MQISQARGGVSKHILELACWMVVAVPPPVVSARNLEIAAATINKRMAL